MYLTVIVRSQIAELFCTHPRLVPFHPLFISCNEIGTADNPGYDWCGRCSKCAFVCLLCSAFLSPERVRGIFLRDMLADEALEPVFLSLLGVEKRPGDPELLAGTGTGTVFKPFECVGTRAEVREAVQRIQGLHRSLPLTDPGTGPPHNLKQLLMYM